MAGDNRTLFMGNGTQLIAPGVSIRTSGSRQCSARTEAREMVYLVFRFLHGGDRRQEDESGSCTEDKKMYILSID